MDSNLYHQLLSELTPEICSYLFPGFVFPKDFYADRPLEEPEIHSISESEAFLADADDGEEFDAAPDFVPESAPKHKNSFSIVSRFFKSLSSAGKCRPSVEDRSSIVESGTSSAAGVLAEDLQLDPRTREILADILHLQEKYHLTIDELELILGYTVRLSPVHITLAGQIFLPDFENREVKMPNISKALYFLFLRHPEGLRYKEVAGHREELLQLYLRVTGRDEPQEIEKSIDLLVDPYGNALNVNASRIKTAFRNVMSDRVARFYYINGAAGDVKKVPLDRDLVIWEH